MHKDRFHSKHSGHLCTACFVTGIDYTSSYLSIATIFVPAHPHMNTPVYTCVQASQASLPAWTAQKTGSIRNTAAIFVPQCQEQPRQPTPPLYTENLDHVQLNSLKTASRSNLGASLKLGTTLELPPCSRITVGPCPVQLVAVVFSQHSTHFFTVLKE